MTVLSNGLLSVELDYDGIAAIVYAGQRVIERRLACRSFLNFDADLKADLKPLGDLVGRAMSDAGEIVHEFQHGEVAMRFSLEGNSLLIEARITNLDGSPLVMPGFVFGHCDGLDPSVYAAARIQDRQALIDGADCRHKLAPSVWLYSAGIGRVGSIFMAGNWRDGGKTRGGFFHQTQGSLPGSWLCAATDVTVKPGESAIIKFRLAFGPTWQDAASGWKADFLAAHGPLRYTADHRPVVMWIRYGGHDRSYVTPENPHGFVDWRPDIAEDDAVTWTRGVVADAKRNNFQGAIAWGFAFTELDKEYWGYPVDSEALGAEQFRWFCASFMEPFLQSGLTPGSLHRIGTNVYLQPHGPAFIPDDAARLADRLPHLAYLDTTPDFDGVESFGDSPEETCRKLAETRAIVGPSHQWFAEFAYDQLLPSCGVYCEMIGGQLPGHAVLARFLYPDCGVLVHDKQDSMTPAAFRQWCDARGMSALIKDYVCGGATAS